MKVLSLALTLSNNNKQQIMYVSVVPVPLLSQYSLALDMTHTDLSPSPAPPLSLMSAQAPCISVAPVIRFLGRGPSYHPRVRLHNEAIVPSYYRRTTEVQADRTPQKCVLFPHLFHQYKKRCRKTDKTWDSKKNTHLWCAD